MNFIKDFTLSSQYFFKSFKYLFKHNLSAYIVAPIIISVLLFYGVWTVRLAVIDYIIAFFDSLFNIEEVVDGSFLMYLKMGLSGVIYITVWITSFYLYFTVSKYVALILLSPVLALLSEKVEEIETGNAYPFKLNVFLSDIWRGVLISCRNLLLELLVIFLVFVVTFFIPILAPLSPFVTFYFSAYFVGFSFMDYNLERRQFSLKNSSKFMRKYSGAVVANGVWFNLLFYIPFVNVLIAPLVAVIAGSLTIETILKPFAADNSGFRRA